MPKAVRFQEYGGLDVLDVVDVERPEPGPDQVLVAVRAAGINPGEAAIREGAVDAIWPATFPSGQGSDLAGTVAAVGPGVTAFATGDEVFGWTDERASQAEYVVVDDTAIVPKPAEVAWEVAGALKVAGTTAYAAVEAVDLAEGDVVVVAGAAGGVGTLTVQLARLRGATVIGLAGPDHHDWLRAHGVVPVDHHGDGVADRIRAVTEGVDAVLDLHGDGYLDLARELGVEPARVNTIADFAGAEKHGIQAVGGAEASSSEVLTELADLVSAGRLEVPIAATYPLDRVRDAFTDLAGGHTLGKIVLLVDPAS